MSHSEPLDSKEPVSDPNWLYYAPLTLQIWTGFAKLREGLAQSAYKLNPIALWTQVISLIDLTDLLKMYLPNSANEDENSSTISITDSKGCLLVAETALETLQVFLASDAEIDPLELWNIWDRLHQNLTALAERLKHQALDEESI
jgi:hypothetical protein